jgi:hypothetical protein
VPKMLSHPTALPVGRQVVHTEPWTKVTLVMLDRDVAYVDVVTVLIRLRHHRAMSRAEILRGLIEFMKRSLIDFSRFATAAEMTEYLAAHFRRNPHRGRVPLLLESSLFHPVRDRWSNRGKSKGRSHRRTRSIQDGEVVTGAVRAFARLRGSVRSWLRNSLPSGNWTMSIVAGLRISLSRRGCDRTTKVFERRLVDAPALTDPALCLIRWNGGHGM